MTSVDALDVSAIVDAGSILLTDEAPLCHCGRFIVSRRCQFCTIFKLRI